MIAMVRLASSSGAVRLEFVELRAGWSQAVKNRSEQSRGTRMPPRFKARVANGIRCGAEVER